ncbi:MAG: tetraacyldisaccharide 4'-kinase [Pseudarcicella sp.]|nr:tetraacyldisaccharide 4'-kinase [Pseudarcicella sp.]
MLQKLSYFFLLPFSLIYDVATRIRNRLFDWGFLKSEASPIFTINVGNLRVGGTGKTPHIEYLANYFVNKNIKIATLSRGYGRKTKGYLEANPLTNSQEIGDEPKQFYTKFGDKVIVTVCENRLLGIQKIIQKNPKVSLVLLDDAFQHRAVISTLNIMLSDYSKPFYSDYLMPAGRLREAKSGAKRADLIIITKCPKNITIVIKSDIIQKTKQYALAQTPIIFSSLEYDEPVSLFNKNSENCLKKVVLLSGIAQSDIFCKDMAQKYTVIKHFNFHDHHQFTEKDLLAIQPFLNDEIKLLMTEKDSIKIKELNLNKNFMNLLFYVPIKIVFSENDALILDSMIKDKWER